MPKITVTIRPVSSGVWPDGEPQSVRIAADRRKHVRGYDVYMVVVGGYDAYEVVAVYEDRRSAGHKARDYNQAHACASDITRCARVEEISFYPAEAPV